MSMRIGGLASGMDIDMMVSDLMRAEKLRYTQVEQNKEILHWKQEQYNEINLSMANFIRDSKTDLGLVQTTSTGSIQNNSVSSLTWVKTASISDEDVAAVTTNAGAVRGTYTVDVARLAENWSAASSTGISSGSTDNIADQFEILATDTINFTITTNSGSVTIDETDLDGVALADIVSEINAANIGVTAIYDTGLDRFFLHTSATGEEATIQISDSSVITGGGTFITGADSLLKMQCLDDTQTPQDITDGEIYSGKDALLDFGAATNISMSSNTFTINNISFNLKGTGTANVTVATNVSAVYEKIEDFVDSYNDLVENIGTKVTETRYRDYLPLTEEQQESMTETQIEQWEEKAKSGLLKNDAILTKISNNVRAGMYQEVTDITGSYDQLVEIGIQTQGYSSGTVGGKLVIDRDKLVNAIETDVDSVLELLFKEPSEDLRTKAESQMTAEEIIQKRSESGLIRRLYDNVIVGMKEIITRAGYGENAEAYRSVSATMLIDFVTIYSNISFLDKDISNLDKKLNKLSDYLVKVEDQYWRKFSAMEKALQQMNQQSAWLTQQFSSGQG